MFNSDVFEDRYDAGRQLARALSAYRGRQPLVLGLPRGGVPVAAEVADFLDAPLDVIVVRKLGAPSNPEFGFGAVSENDVTVIDDTTCDALGVGRGAVDEIARQQRQEVDRRVAMFRQGRRLPDLMDRIVVIVDDGLATGSTAAAAVASARAAGAARIVLAVPVGSSEAVRRLQRVADEVICLRVPPDFRAVGAHYRNFEQVPDDTVREILARDRTREVSIPIVTSTGRTQRLPGMLTVPPGAQGLVVFAHGSGSSRHSPRNARVARILHEGALATLLFDLLHLEEEPQRRLVFDVEFLSDRLLSAMEWCRQEESVRALPLGLFGASTGAAAALIAAARSPGAVSAVVSRGGRPDLADAWLPKVRTPTLLIVGGDDIDVLRLNRWAGERMPGIHRIEVVPHATHLFEEPGTLDQAAALARNWFQDYLAASKAA